MRKAVRIMAEANRWRRENRTKKGKKISEKARRKRDRKEENQPGKFVAEENGKYIEEKRS